MARSSQLAYDGESGQVYVEGEVRVKKRQHSDWIGEYKTPSLVKRSRPNGHGSRSLLDTAKATAVRNVRSMDAGHIAVLSWPLAEMMWGDILATHTESFHAWRIFATAKGGEGFNQPRHRYLVDLKTPSLSLADYFRGITSAERHWWTCLRISPRQIPVPDLVAIAHIQNLAVLDLSDGQITIDGVMSVLDERVMRTWAELAADQGAFQHLRVLLLGWQEKVARWIFKYLDSFPSLRCVILTDCLHLHQKNRGEWEEEAMKHHWTGRAGKRSAKSLRPLLEDRSFHWGSVSSCYYHSQDTVEPDAEKMGSSRPTVLPVLECWIGTPRVWSHIVDEFPSTRTVWFDKSPSDRSHVKTADVKRVREGESGPKEPRSPPAKKTQPRMKAKACTNSVADMLAEFQPK